MSKPPFFFVAVIAVIVVLASLRYLQQRRQDAEHDRAPASLKTMVVSSKREVPVTKRRSREQQVSSPADTVRYEMGFRAPQGGVEMRFRVTAQQYHAVSVGDHGTLHYQGTRFLEFTPAP